MQEGLPLGRAIRKWRSSDGNAIGVGFEHKVEELAGGIAKTRVEIRIGDVIGGMSREEEIDLSSGVGDDGGDSDKRGEGSIGIGL